MSAGYQLVIAHRGTPRMAEITSILISLDLAYITIKSRVGNAFKLVSTAHTHTHTFGYRMPVARFVSWLH